MNRWSASAPSRRTSSRTHNSTRPGRARTGRPRDRARDRPASRRTRGHRRTRQPAGLLALHSDLSHEAVAVHRAGSWRGERPEPQQRQGDSRDDEKEDQRQFVFVVDPLIHPMTPPANTMYSTTGASRRARTDFAGAISNPRRSSPPSRAGSLWPTRPRPTGRSRLARRSPDHRREGPAQSRRQGWAAPRAGTGAPIGGSRSPRRPRSPDRPAEPAENRPGQSPRMHTTPTPDAHHPGTATPPIVNRLVATKLALSPEVAVRR